MKKITGTTHMLGLLIIASMTACAGSDGRLPWQKAPTASITPESTSIPTPAPLQTLNICLGEEPESLYIYAQRQSSAMWSVLEAIYDGPFDTLSTDQVPVLFQKKPSYEDGDLYKTSVIVKGGDLIVNTDNELVALIAGARFLPAGCNNNSCAETWDGSGEIQMDQLNVIFKLRSNLLWSDGVPLTAKDSRFSYEISSDRSSTSMKSYVDRTQEYSVEDDSTIKWIGVPGYFSEDLSSMFWIPLPKHILGETPISLLAESEMVARQPLGWGPYILNKWVAGEYIELNKNPNYFRANENLPKFDRLVYHFRNPSSGGSLAALVTGQCDIVERSSNPQSDISMVIAAEKSGQAISIWKTGPESLQLVIGINPGEYDNGYNAAIDRPDYFRNPAVRQALAVCIDRQSIAKDVFSEKAGLATLNDLLGINSGSINNTDLTFDPDLGNRLLEEAGWTDLDGDSKTARTAINVSGIPGGTPLSLELLTDADEISVAVASAITDALAGCGIEVVSEVIPFDELFAPGPGGKIFGRTFDLTLISWQHSQIPACYLYMTEQIPDGNNYWVGGNVSGYSNVEFDMACSGLLHLSPNDSDYELKLKEAVSIFTEDLPAIPLFSLPKVMLTRPDFCNINYDPAARSDLTGIELFDYGLNCSQ